MKKVILILAFLFGTGLYAQNQNTAPNGTHPASQEDLARFAQAQAEKKAAQAKKAKTAGGIVSQRMSHADIADNQFSTLLQGFISPIFQDSTVVDDFGTLDPVGSHAYAQTFDVYSASFLLMGQDYFELGDAYNVDTIYTAGFYDLVNNKSVTNTGDTLVLDIVWGNPASASMWRQGLQWPANTWSNQTTAADILPVRYTGSAGDGYAGDVTWANKITIKKGLTPADTNVTYHKFVPNTPINVPAGARFGISVRFKSGETYSPGDVYFAGANSTSTATMNSFRVFILGAAGAGDNSAYFLEEFSLQLFSWASTQPWFSDQRYDPSANTFATPQGAQGAAFDIWVTGTSTVSLDENNFANDVELFPNPTNGFVNIAISQGGTYTIELVNMLGQVVHSEEVSVSGNEKLSRNFSNLNKGLYLVNIKGDNYSNTSKLTISK